VTFSKKLFFYGEEFLPHAQPPIWSTTPCWLFATLNYIRSYPPHL